MLQDHTYMLRSMFCCDIYIYICAWYGIGAIKDLQTNSKTPPILYAAASGSVDLVKYMESIGMLPVRQIYLCTILDVEFILSRL